MINYIGIINWTPNDYAVKRQNQLGTPYYYSFIELTANWVYDFGYFLSIIIALLYYNIVVLVRPKNGEISIENLLLIVLLVQIPLFSIFYSFLAGIVIPFIFWCFFKIYFIYRKEKLKFNMS